MSAKSDAQSETASVGGDFPFGERLVLNAFGLLVVVLMAAIVAQVICSRLDINPIAEFAISWPVVGTRITLNSLLDAQWHLLVLIALLPAWLVWRRDGHVRVDFIYAKLAPGTRSLIELAGHVIFAAPFLFVSIPAAWSFMESALRSGQGSSNDGLNDLFLIKGALPFGLAFLAVVMVVDIVAQARQLAGR